MFEIGVTHTIDAGHRVVGHEDGRGKCARLHGHTYRFDVSLYAPDLDRIGFVTDFGVVKAALNEWDHRMLLWDADPLLAEPPERHAAWLKAQQEFREAGVVELPFNPTAENMARHFAERFRDLDGIEKALVEVRETPKTVARFTAVDEVAFGERMQALAVETHGLRRTLESRDDL